MTKFNRDHNSTDRGPGGARGEVGSGRLWGETRWDTTIGAGLGCGAEAWPYVG